MLLKIGKQIKNVCCYVSSANIQVTTRKEFTMNTNTRHYTPLGTHVLANHSHLLQSHIHFLILCSSLFTFFYCIGTRAIIRPQQGSF